MASNEWKSIAEVYRNREHNLIKFLRQYIDDDRMTLDELEKYVTGHLESTGRSSVSPLDTPAISLVDDDVRLKLLALLQPSQAELGAVTIKVRTRKVRSDKGQPRKVKVKP